MIDSNRMDTLPDGCKPKDVPAPVHLFDHGRQIVCRGCLVERAMPSCACPSDLAEYHAVIRDFAHKHRDCLEPSPAILAFRRGETIHDMLEAEHGKEANP